MTTYAHKLEAFKLDTNTPVYLLTSGIPSMLKLDDPAIKAMTDLQQVKAITVSPDSSIEFAMELMQHAGIRMLVVIDQSGMLAGLITARDITGEKPLRILTQDRVKREEILVRQIMTPRDQLNPFNFRDVEHASVRDVIVQLRKAGRQHAIVLEAQEKGAGYFVRGIFSITQIGRHLGMDIPVDGLVQSFADFEKLIA
jgi:signal-transduction protein with cAMP-binding, CBS, and nucleotidyltransferase domain